WNKPSNSSPTMNTWKLRPSPFACAKKFCSTTSGRAVGRKFAPAKKLQANDSRIIARRYRVGILISGHNPGKKFGQGPPKCDTVSRNRLRNRLRTAVFNL